MQEVHYIDHHTAYIVKLSGCVFQGEDALDEEGT
jgi:hypothetical protein